MKLSFLSLKSGQHLKEDRLHVGKAENTLVAASA